MVVVELHVWPQTAVVAVQITGIDIRSRSHGEQVGDGSTNDGSFETVRVSDGPRSHEAAVAPSANAKMISICDSARHEEIYAVHAVLEVAIAPVAIIRFGEGSPGAIGTARV